MNDRPDRVPDRPASGHPADRLVHSGRDGRDEGLGDTGPTVPPQRVERVSPDASDASDTSNASNASNASHASAASATGDEPAATHDDAPAGRPGDLADTGPGLTDADRPDTAGAEVPDPAHAGPGASGGAPATRLPLLDGDPAEVRRRWQQVQVGFVDDPRGAVERAESLLGEVTDGIRAALEARVSDLRSRWKDGDGDTERLRTALRGYRSVLEQLLELAAAPAGSGTPGTAPAPGTAPSASAPSVPPPGAGGPSGDAASADASRGVSGSSPAGRE
ncbi:hypothetical protein GCM10010466_33060 [Planomonospora alba]|uniref:Uncharacterized protein n=1 Tax=Planomonospora alba TaxID=161354 RepID=A0ABP6N8C4_9ACTN